MAHWVVAINSTLLGEFEAGWAAAARADASGQAMGDLRLQNYAAWTTGWIDATSGEWSQESTRVSRASSAPRIR
jgi:hypothetical protein